MTDGHIWECKIGEVSGVLPLGADAPMRFAVARAYKEITGHEPLFLFSGWGGELDEGERAVVENREPDPLFYAEQRKRDAAHDLYEALREAVAYSEASSGLSGIPGASIAELAVTVESGGRFAFNIDRARAALAKACPTPAIGSGDHDAD